LARAADSSSGSAFQLNFRLSIGYCIFQLRLFEATSDLRRTLRSVALPSGLLPACAFCRPSSFTFRLTVDSRRPSVFQICLPSNFRLSSKSDSQRSFRVTVDLRRRPFFRPAFEPISDFCRISHSWTSPSDQPPACAGCQPSKLCLPTDLRLASPICLPALPSCLPPTCAGCLPSSSALESNSERTTCVSGSKFRRPLLEPARRTAT